LSAWGWLILDLARRPRQRYLCLCGRRHCLHCHSHLLDDRCPRTTLMMVPVRRPGGSLFGGAGRSCCDWHPWQRRQLRLLCGPSCQHPLKGSCFVLVVHVLPDHRYQAVGSAMALTRHKLAAASTDRVRRDRPRQGRISPKKTAIRIVERLTPDALTILIKLF
jgi:hypothetical protein